VTITAIIEGAHRAATDLQVRRAIDPLTGPIGAALVLDQNIPIYDALRAEWATIGLELVEAETRLRLDTAAVVTAQVVTGHLPPVDAVAEVDPATMPIDMATLLLDDDEDELPKPSPELAHWLRTGEPPTTAFIAAPTAVIEHVTEVDD